MGSVRAAHEAFVSGHSGTTPLDVLLAAASALPATVLAITVVRGRVGWLWFALDCLLLVTPVILGFTVLADYTPQMFLILVALAALSVHSSQSHAGPQAGGSHKEGKRVACITSFRAMLNLAATVSILAVDFRCFPRRFAKTEEHGYSIMDLGAAGYVLANGLVEGKRRTSSWSMVRDVVLLVGLGLGRLVMVRAADYQHPLTEYGVHGNFFFTLAAIKVLCSWWVWRVGCVGSVCVGVGLCVAHQLLLSVGGVAVWTLGDTPRDTLLAANREWVVGLPSYIALYFIGAAVGARACDRSKRASLSRFLLAVVALSGCLVAALHTCVDPPSRRLGNATFVSFCVMYAITFLASFSLVGDWLLRWLPGVPPVPGTFQAINDRALLCFLLANVCTGLINKSVDTLAVPFPWDLGVVATYTYGVLGVLYFLYKMDSR